MLLLTVWRRKGLQVGQCLGFAYKRVGTGGPFMGTLPCFWQLEGWDLNDRSFVSVFQRAYEITKELDLNLLWKPQSSLIQENGDRERQGFVFLSIVSNTRPTRVSFTWDCPMPAETQPQLLNLQETTGFLGVDHMGQHNCNPLVSACLLGILLLHARSPKEAKLFSLRAWLMLSRGLVPLVLLICSCQEHTGTYVHLVCPTGGLSEPLISGVASSCYCCVHANYLIAWLQAPYRYGRMTAFTISSPTAVTHPSAGPGTQI